VVILIHDKGIPAILKEQQPLVTALLKAQAAVAIAEVRLTGSLARNWSLDGVLLGRPEAGMAATDLRAIVDVLTQQPGVNAKPVSLVALGETGVSALCAAVLDERIGGLIIPALGPTYAEGRPTPLIGNLLRAGDLPHLAATLAPRRLHIGGVKPEAFAFTTEAYRAFGQGAALELKTEPLATAKLAGTLP
jgi:hypothetical protein